jgi:cytochrome c oxidase assembly protein subunit 15
MTGASIHKRQNKQVASWLLCVAGAVFLMIILGGVTRLTESGLSMVDWNPVMGVIPPLSEEQWQETFRRYQAFPEYQKINQGMLLEEFKTIFYFEYFHRLLGRLIGLLFLLPFLVFWYRGAIQKSQIPQMFVMFVLGGCQGLLGWYMVKSGLVNDPRVSQYRLVAHLMAAVTIYAYILWIAFGLIKAAPDRTVDKAERKLYRYAVALNLLIAFMIMTGGFVAGTHAGFAYNTFPLMAGKIIPDGMYVLQPLWLNWFENITAVQFNHRLIAYLLALLIPLFCFFVSRQGITARSRKAAYFLLLMLLVQFVLGVTTILLSVPVVVAASHQGGAIILLSIALFITREIKPENSR